MKNKIVDNQPQEITEYPEIDPKEQDAIECVNEIFKTPLTGSYNWDYTVVDDRIKKLYELGKRLNWNVSDDLDWSQTHPKDEFLVNQEFRLVPDEIVGLDELSLEDRLQMDRHQVSWNLSQFLHGEQGALLVASQLVSCAPTFNAKMYAASQTFDEARHVEGFNRYLKEKIGFQYPDYIAPFIPSWFAQSIIPIGLILIWYQMIITSSSDLKYRLSVSFISIIPTIVLYFWQFPLANSFLLWSKVIFSITLVAFGLPIFILLALLSILFFLSEPSEWATNYDLISTISDSAYRIVVSPTLAAIPIFIKISKSVLIFSATSLVLIVFILFIGNYSNVLDRMDLDVENPSFSNLWRCSSAG